MNERALSLYVTWFISIKCHRRGHLLGGPKCFLSSTLLRLKIRYNWWCSASTTTCGQITVNVGNPRGLSTVQLSATDKQHCSITHTIDSKVSSD